MRLLLILAHMGFLLAQAPAVGPVPDTFDGERFKTLVVDDRLQLGVELNRYASLGYRITEVRGDRVLLERSAHSEGHREYLVLVRDKWVTIERAMNEAVTRGFRFLPRALFVYRGVWSKTLAVVMEKVVSDGSSSGLRYRIEWADEKKLIRAARDGYHVVGIARRVWKSQDPDGIESTIYYDTAVLEKPDSQGKNASDASAVASRRDFKVLVVSDSWGQLQELTARGFVIAFAQHPFLLLVKTGMEPQPEYVVVVERKRADLERGMNDAAQRGFRVIPETFFSSHIASWFLKPVEGVIMERRTGSPGPEPEYLMNTADEKELASLAARGYTHVTGPIVMRPRRPQ